MRKKKFQLDPSKGTFLIIRFPPGKDPDPTYAKSIADAWEEFGGQKTIFLPFGYSVSDLSEEGLKELGLKKIEE